MFQRRDSFISCSPPPARATSSACTRLPSPSRSLSRLLVSDALALHSATSAGLLDSPEALLKGLLDVTPASDASDTWLPSVIEGIAALGPRYDCHPGLWRRLASATSSASGATCAVAVCAAAAALVTASPPPARPSPLRGEPAQKTSAHRQTGAGFLSEGVVAPAGPNASAAGATPAGDLGEEHLCSLERGAGVLLEQLRGAAAVALRGIAAAPARLSSADPSWRRSLLSALLFLSGSSHEATRGAAREALVALSAKEVTFPGALKEMSTRADTSGLVAAFVGRVARAVRDAAWGAAGQAVLGQRATAELFGVAALALREWASSPRDSRSGPGGEQVAGVCSEVICAVCAVLDCARARHASYDTALLVSDLSGAVLLVQACRNTADAHVCTRDAHTCDIPHIVATPRRSCSAWARCCRFCTTLSRSMTTPLWTARDSMEALRRRMRSSLARSDSLQRCRWPTRATLLRWHCSSVGSGRQRGSAPVWLRNSSVAWVAVSAKGSTPLGGWCTTRSDMQGCFLDPMHIGASLASINCPLSLAHAVPDDVMARLRDELAAAVGARNLLASVKGPLSRSMPEQLRAAPVVPEILIESLGTGGLTRSLAHARPEAKGGAPDQEGEAAPSCECRRGPSSMMDASISRSVLSFVELCVAHHLRPGCNPCRDHAVFSLSPRSAVYKEEARGGRSACHVRQWGQRLFGRTPKKQSSWSFFIGGEEGKEGSEAT